MGFKMVKFCQQVLKPLSSYSRIFTVFPSRSMLYRGERSQTLRLFYSNETNFNSSKKPIQALPSILHRDAKVACGESA